MTYNINWIDVTKAICMLSVYLIHCSSFANFNTGIIGLLLCTFYVNAFFFVNGYLLFKKQLSVTNINLKLNDYILAGGGKMLSNIVFKLLIPTILFSLIEFVPKIMVKGGEFKFCEILLDTVGGCSFWFTSSLVVAQLLIWTLLLTRLKNIWFYFICSCVAAFIGVKIANGGACFIPEYPMFPWNYQQGFICMFYVCAGGIYMNYEKAINKATNGYIITLLIFIILGALVLCPYPSFCYSTSTADTNLLGAVLSLCSCIALIEVCKLIPYTKFIKFVSKNSIVYYFFSGGLPLIFTRVALHYSSMDWILLCVVFSISFGIATIAVFILQKWMPYLFDLRILNNI